MASKTLFNILRYNFQSLRVIQHRWTEYFKTYSSSGSEFCPGGNLARMRLPVEH